ncbi:MAG: 4'-phosphopantetheinyl transferase superfamily protein [Rikenellaceae bacterium]|nr:4'-phosphopantetheinyl transferase superfamily protein [Rikenellaceae bacterium]
MILDTGGPGWRLVVWVVTESYHELERCVTPADIAAAAGISSAARRAGRLAARAALRVMAPGAVVGYDSHGAPFLASPGQHMGREGVGALLDGNSERDSLLPQGCGEGTGLHVSFSHCPGAAAAIVARGACAVDIERADRNFERAAPRFVSERERTVRGSFSGLFLPAVWCAKETLYKYARTPGTDLLRDIEIESFDPAAGEITARLGKRSGIRVAFRTVDGYICCHIPGGVSGSERTGAKTNNI